MQAHKVRWKVSLSNGETFYEGKGSYKEIEGDFSPWNKLAEYIEEESVKITSLSLYTDEGINMHIPSSGNNPKFHLFKEDKKPKQYRMFRAISSEPFRDADDQTVEHYTVIEAEYDDYRLQVWASELSSSNFWVNVVKI